MPAILEKDRNETGAIYFAPGSTLTTAAGVVIDLSLATVKLPAFQGDAGNGGTSGAVPAPPAGSGANKEFLCARGDWEQADPMTDSGDMIYGGVGGVATRLPKSADGKVLTLQNGLPAWLASQGGDGGDTPGGGATGSVWQTLITESGASLANFTTASGSWAVNSNGVIECDSNANGNNAQTLWHNTAVPLGLLSVFQVDIFIASTQTPQSDMRAYILFAGDGTANNNNPGARLQCTSLQTETVSLEQQSVSALGSSQASWTLDAWHTLAVAFSGATASVYLDGVLLFSSNSVASRGSKVGLSVISVNAQYRNLKASALALPS